MLKDTLECPTGHFLLSRPGANSKQPLRAWDAADEYLINHTLDHHDGEALAIFNDQFGALGCVLNQQTVFWSSDSYCATQALQLNLDSNQLTLNATISNALTGPANNTVELALMKLPKNLSFLQHQLKLCFDAGIKTLLIAGMMKHLPKNILELLQKYGTVNRLPFKKKATVFQLNLEQAHNSPYPKLNTFEGIQLCSHANVFGRDKLDPGARVFLQHIKSLPKANNVADLCCGSGILGLKYSELFSPEGMDFFDESQMAVKSTEDAWALNHNVNETSSTQSRFYWDDGLSQGPNTFYDLILCNPPFHEQHTVGDHIAQRLFKDAKRCLTTDGQLIIVGNRHLGYQQTLKRHFKHVKQLASDSKFIILSAHN